MAGGREYQGHTNRIQKNFHIENTKNTVESPLAEEENTRIIST